MLWELYLFTLTPDDIFQGETSREAAHERIDVFYPVVQRFNDTLVYYIH